MICQITLPGGPLAKKQFFYLKFIIIEKHLSLKSNTYNYSDKFVVQYTFNSICKIQLKQLKKNCDSSSTVNMQPAEEKDQSKSLVKKGSINIHVNGLKMNEYFKSFSSNYYIFWAVD